jgi:hypothetical protein
LDWLVIVITYQVDPFSPRPAGESAKRTSNVTPMSGRLSGPGDIDQMLPAF